MINHIRTLLLDESGQNKPDWSFPLEEFVPTDFSPQKFPAEVKRVWNTLFGLKPDRAYKNWRLFQLSTLAQSSDLLKYWFTFDPRVTHFDKPNDDYSQDYGKAKVYMTKGNSLVSLVLSYSNGFISPFPEISLTNQTTRPDDLNVYFSGKLLPDDVNGKSYSSWKIDLNSSNELQVQNLSNKALNKTYQLVFSSGLSQPIILEGLDLGILFKNAGEASWSIDAVSKPEKDIGVVLANLDSLSTTDLQYVFSGSRPEVKTFKNYWTKNEDTAERLTALTLALAYKIDEKRER